MEIPTIAGVNSYLGLPTCTSSKTCAWAVTDLSTPGITLCNLTEGNYGTSNLSQNTATTPTASGFPPLVRVSAGDHRLWGANESYQCLWAEQKSNLGNGGFAISGSNGNLAYFSGIPSGDENSSQSFGLGTGYTADSGSGGITGTKGEYVVQVQACVSAALTVNESCETYTNTSVTPNVSTLKPTGLLQKYAEPGQIKFGLITGSYDKNISGGVVRKNIPAPTVNGSNSITDEINPSNGIFQTSAGASTSGVTAYAGIIATLNDLKVYGYNYESGGGADNYGDGDGCPYQGSGIVHSGASGAQVNEGNCSNWGNPISEAYLEAVRYFAGAGLSGGDSPTSLFANVSGTRDTALRLNESTWTDPLSSNNYCASLNVLTFNGAVPAYEDTSSGNASYYNGFSNLSLTETPAVGVSPTTGTGVAGWTNLVGTGEGINGNSYFIGSVVGTTLTTDSGYQRCTAKSIGLLSNASGVCPDGPALLGSYMMSGVAYAAHINRIRSDLNASIPASDTSSLKVNSYGVQLASNSPKISILVPGTSGATSQYVTITPTYTATWGAGRLIDFRIVQPYATTSCPSGTASGTYCGSYYVNWEDSQQGGDFDQDLWGVISYAITATQIVVTTDAIGASSGNPQAFGFTIGGTKGYDGPHFFSGAYSFGFTDPTGIPSPPNCKLTSTPDNGSCVTPAAPQSFTFPLNTTASATSQSLQDPLWYASKWGGFTDNSTDPNGKPLVNGTTDCPTNDPNCKWDAYIFPRAFRQPQTRCPTITPWPPIQPS